MPKTKISEFSATPGNNTDIDGINISEGCAPSGINDAIRELMAQLKDFQAGTAGDSFNGPVGTTTPAAGAFTSLSASGAFALTGDQVQISEGGTGQTTANAAFNALAPSQATHAGKYLKTDGTNTSWDALDISTADITGTLPVANGGTGVTSSTGTGSVVLSASPTFTGTVNAAALTLSGAATLNGGTANGVAYLNGSKVLTTGSALTFDGTNLGVGTPNPAAFGLVAVNGASASVNINATSGVAAFRLFEGAGTGRGSITSLNGSDGLAFLQGTTEAMRLTSTGLGIGTTSINSRLVVQQANNTGDGIRLFANGNDSQLLTRYVASIDAWQVSASYASTGAYKPIAWFTSDVERMRLDSSGNLGIGTSSPGVKLDVSGADGVRSRVIATSGGTSGLILSSAGNTAYTIKAGNADNSLRIDQDGTDRLTLASGGNLGIGTSSPLARLTVSDSTTTNGTMTLGNNASYHGKFEYTFSTGELRISQVGGSSLGTTFYTNGVERLRIDGSGNLGLGTTTPTNSGGYSTLSLNGSTGGQLVFQTGGTYRQAIYSSSTDLNFYNQAAGNLAFFTNATERARITSGGQLLVKTTADNGVTCHFNGGANANIIRLTGASTTNSGYIGMDGDNFTITTGASILERARITSGGDLLVGTSSGQVAATVVAYRASAATSCVGAWSAATSGDNLFIDFYTEATATLRGSIDYNRAGGLTRYNTTSDYRAKDIIGPAKNTGATIDALKVYEGVMKNATQSRPMMIAHEAQAVVPFCVSGTKDETNEDGTPKYQQMDHASLVPLLIAEIQSLRARVAALETK